MNKLIKILTFIILFTTLIMFTGVVYANNLALNHGNSVQSVMGNNSDNFIIAGNTLTDTRVGTASLNSNNTTLTENNITSSEIQDVQTINTTGIVMSSTTSNCGPASLATVLQKMSINVSQDVLAAIAGTDENGTTMYGLAQAAQLSGVFVKGLKLTVNELKPENMAYLNIEGTGHYSVITSVNGSIVYLADTDLGNINMTYANFTAAYIQNTVSGYGYALVVTNNSSDPQLSNNNTLTEDDAEAIKGTGLGVYVYGSNLYAVYVLGWKKENPIIQNLANGIMKAYKPKTITQKAQAIFDFVYRFSVTHWENHKDTKNNPNYVLYHHSANCAETARLVYLLAQDMSIPDWRIRYVHNKKAQHYWVQIYCGVSRYTDRYWRYWKDLDCSHAYDSKGINKFGEFIEQTGKYGNPMSLSVREYNVIS